MTNAMPKSTPIIADNPRIKILPNDYDVKYRKDGQPKRTRNNRKTGEDTEVYAFRTREEIKAITDVFDKRIKNSENNMQYYLAERNKLFFILRILGF